MIPVFISSTNLVTSHSLLETLKLYQEAGIQAVELGSGHSPFPHYAELISSFPFEYSVHNYFPLSDPNHLLNIASTQPSQLDKTRNIARNAIDLCDQIGSGLYSIHAGYRSDLDARSLGSRLVANETESHKNAYQIMVETTQELCDYALAKNIDVIVENHVLAQFNLINGKNTLLFLCTAEEIVHFAQSVDRKNFGMLIDVAHLNVTANTLGFDKYQFIDAVTPWIKLFHLSDNDGQTDLGLPFGKGVWFEPVIKQLATIPCVIETLVDDISFLLQQFELVANWQTT